MKTEDLTRLLVKFVLWRNDKIKLTVREDAEEFVLHNMDTITALSKTKELSEENEKELQFLRDKNITRSNEKAEIQSKIFDLQSELEAKNKEIEQWKNNFKILAEVIETDKHPNNIKNNSYKS